MLRTCMLSAQRSALRARVSEIKWIVYTAMGTLWPVIALVILADCSNYWNAVSSFWCEMSVNANRTPPLWSIQTILNCNKTILFGTNTTLDTNSPKIPKLNDWMFAGQLPVRIRCLHSLFLVQRISGILVSNMFLWLKTHWLRCGVGKRSF